MDIPNDPWSDENPIGTPAGATSYNLWVTRPAVTTNQYPSGDPIAEPPVNDYLIEVDDSNPSNTAYAR